MRRTLRALLVGLVLFMGAGSAMTVEACPMCKHALANDKDPVAAARPKAYMYSILFMLSMPATLTTLFGISFYRLARQQQAINAALLAEQSEPNQDFDGLSSRST